MLSEKDRAVVDAYCRSGMSPDTLYLSFPGFPKEEILQIYEDYRRESGAGDAPEPGISINCS